MLSKQFGINWSGDIGRIDIKGHQPTGEAEAKLVFTGDVGLSRGVGKAIQDKGSAEVLSEVSSCLFDSDYFIFNLECCITDKGKPWEPNKPSPMVGQPDYLDILPSEYKNYVANLSNNHLLDHGVIGASETINALKNRDIDYFGIKVDNKNKISTIYANDTSIALVAFAPSAHPIPGDGVPINIYTGKSPVFEHDIKEASSQHDLTIVNLHQGVEYCPYVMRSARLLARHAIDLGADCVICHHAHVIQGIELYKGKVIFHGIGNLLIDIDFKKDPLSRYSLVPHIYIRDRKIDRIEMQAFKIQSDFKVRLLSAIEMEEIKNVIYKRSRYLATEVGCLMNDVLALYIRVTDRSGAAIRLFRRKGLKSTLAYYFNRVFGSRH